MAIHFCRVSPCPICYANMTARFQEQTAFPLMILNPDTMEIHYLDDTEVSEYNENQLLLWED